MASAPEESSSTAVDSTTMNKSGIPFHPSSSPQSTTTKPTPIKIPDGRRNSHGEVLGSPTETWRPKLDRTQSWNREDLKRVVYKEMVEREVEEAGEDMGFTEVEEVLERSG